MQDFLRNFKTYYLVEAVHSSLQATGFKVKNTFDKIYYFTFNLGFTQSNTNYSFSLMDGQKFIMTNQKHISELAHDFRQHRVLREHRENITVKLFGISFINLIVLLLLQKFWNVGYSIRFTVNYDSFSTSDFASFENSRGYLSFCQLYR